MEFYKYLFKRFIYNTFFISTWAEKPRTFWKLLSFILKKKKPKSILELGSGKSTFYFLKYVSKNKNINFISLEHHYLWYRRQINMINNNFGNKFSNCIKFSKIIDDWYDYKSNKQFDFIFLDGPNQYSFLKKNNSRRDSKIAIKFLKKKIKNCKVLIVDDIQREAEKNLIKKLNLKLKSTTINYNNDNYLTIFANQNIQKKIRSFLTNIKLNKKIYVLK